MWSNVWQVAVPGVQIVTVTYASFTAGALVQIEFGPQSTTSEATFGAALAITCKEPPAPVEPPELLNPLEPLDPPPPHPARHVSASTDATATFRRITLPFVDPSENDPAPLA